MIIVKRKVGADASIEVRSDNDDMAAALLELTWVMELDQACGQCASGNVGLRSRQVKKDGDVYVYPEQFCRDCGARRQAGQYKSPKGVIYMKRGWDAPYGGSANGEHYEEGF